MNAKKHPDFVESKVADNMALGTRTKLHLLRSDRYLYEDKVAMAMEKAREANGLIHRHGLKLEFAPAKSRIGVSNSGRIDHLLTMLEKENEEWQETKFSSSTNDYLVESESAHSDKFGTDKDEPDQSIAIISFHKFSK